MASEKIEEYERRIKELEDKAMHLEIDKRAREQIINMLKEDRETLFGQVSNHVRTITDQARIIGQLETRLELGPGRTAEVEQEPAERPAAREAEPVTRNIPMSEPAQNHEERVPEPPYRSQEPSIEYPPRYGAYEAAGQGDNRSAGDPGTGVQ